MLIPDLHKPNSISRFISYIHVKLRFTELVLSNRNSAENFLYRDKL